jgi:hypothetical protein
MLIASILGGVAAVVTSVALLVRSVKGKKKHGPFPPLVPPPR